MNFDEEQAFAPSRLAITRTALGNLLAALMRHDPRGTATEVYQAQLDIAKAMDEAKQVMGFPFSGDEKHSWPRNIETPAQAREALFKMADGEIPSDYRAYCAQIAAVLASLESQSDASDE
jgi:hypothetical protein